MLHHIDILCDNYRKQQDHRCYRQQQPKLLQVQLYNDNTHNADAEVSSNWVRYITRLGSNQGAIDDEPAFCSCGKGYRCDGAFVRSGVRTFSTTRSEGGHRNSVRVMGFFDTTSVPNPPIPIFFWINPLIRTF